MTTNAQKIAAWRKANRGAILTTHYLCEIMGLPNLSGANLSGANLSGADLSGADLYGADLSGADLSGTNLYGANLYGADLSGADLYGADLYGADLSGANLRGADLYGANLYGANLRGADLYGAFQLNGLPSGYVIMFPTYDGWTLKVGCWSGSVEELRLMVQGDTGWPEAKGEELVERRPGLLLLCDMLDDHQKRNADLIVELAAKWGKK